VYNIFIVGTAGCGKSLLTHSLKDWFTSKGSHVITVNLDPGAESLPYQPDVDIRLFVDIHQLMQRYQLGPNGALVLATDMAASKLEEIQDDIDSYNAEFVIFDTPGQVELFAYRPGGEFLARQLSADEKALIFVFDAWLCTTPENFLSLTLLASSVKLRFGLPFLPILNKVDLAGEDAQRVIRWAAEPETLLRDISGSLKGDDYLLYRSLTDDLIKNEFIERLLPVSASTNQGMEDLSGSLTMLFKGGEESEE
jgi:GTPase SAR1 family protein